MGSSKSTPRQPGVRRPGLACVHSLLCLGLATAAAASRAADSLSGLSAAFRPQALAEPARVRAPGPGGAPVAATPGLRVLVVGKSRASATIDGRLVHVGDMVNGMRVAEINVQGVVLKGGEGSMERLMMNPGVVKQTTPARDKNTPEGNRP